MAPSQKLVTLGVDIGSTNTKVVAVDRGGAVVGRRSRPTPRSDDGSIEPTLLLTALESLVLALASGRFAVAAIATAGVGEDGFLADPGLRPLTTALPWFDERRAGALDATPELGGTPESGTGIALDPARTVAAWAWLRQHRPDALTAGGWLGITDYPLVAWTGIRFITDNLASRSAAWSPWTREWLPSRIAPTLGDAGRLPPVLHAGSIVGPIAVPGLRDVLTSNAVAVSAGHDHPVGGRVVDQVATGAVLDSMGTAEVVVCQVRRMPSSKPADIDVSPGITQPGATLLGVHELTRNLAWIKESRPVLVPYIDELLTTPTRRPMEEGDVFTVGRQGGESPGWHPGSWQLPPKAMAFAALMACARASAPTIERLMHLGGGSRVMAAGGWARSAGWLSLKEIALGRLIERIQEPEVTATGAALIAGDAVGWTQDPALALGL